MITRFGIILAALLIGLGSVQAAELEVPGKARRTAHPLSVHPIEGAHRGQPEHGASNCTFIPLCWLFGAQANNR